jgi:integrase
MRKPYFSKSRKRWFVRQGQTQVNLGPDKSKAFKRYHQLMSGQTETAPTVFVADILGQYLDWSEAHQAESTYGYYRFWLKSFGKHIQQLRVEDLKPYHLTRWLDAKRYSNPNTLNAAVRAVVRAFNWAVKMGVLKENPLKGAERPSLMPRECYITPQQFDSIMATIRDDDFRDLVTFLRETGCRPQEARRAEARHFDRSGQTLTFPREESKGKRRQRVIVLTPTALAVVQRLSLKHPDGALFRNRDGSAWSRHSLNCRFSFLHFL